MRPFVQRTIGSQGVVNHGAWRLKRYTITRETETSSQDWQSFADGRGLAFAALPSPAQTAQRPGVGFVIEHRGLGADYVVLAWWDRENELPVRVLVRDHAPEAEWRAAGATESFCVWDLQVITFERDAYVNTVLAPHAAEGALEQYLTASLYLETRPPTAG
jgi:hypothetical protein